jgi:glycopeptide antibiotics resistance protein
VIPGGVMWAAWLPAVAAVVFIEVRSHAGLGHTLGVVFLTTYAFWIASVAFFPMPLHPSAVESAKGDMHFSINLVPLRASFRSLPHLSPVQIVREYGGNLLLLAPVTALVPVLWYRLRGWKWALAVGVGVSMAIELLQLGFSALVGYGYRAVDIDDVILNTVGALVGYAVFLGARRLVSGDAAATASPVGRRPGPTRLPRRRRRGRS